MFVKNTCPAAPKHGLPASPSSDRFIFRVTSLAVGTQRTEMEKDVAKIYLLGVRAADLRNISAILRDFPTELMFDSSLASVNPE